MSQKKSTIYQIIDILAFKGGGPYESNFSCLRILLLSCAIFPPFCFVLFFVCLFFKLVIAFLWAKKKLTRRFPANLQELAYFGMQYFFIYFLPVKSPMSKKFIFRVSIDDLLLGAKFR